MRIFRMELKVERQVEHLLSNPFLKNSSKRQCRRRPLTQQVVTRIGTKGYEPSYSFRTRKSAAKYDNKGSLMVHRHTPSVQNRKNKKIYCYGELLHAAQFSTLSSDSKAFVDMKMKYDQDEILQKYQLLKSELEGHDRPDKNSELMKFILNNFDPLPKNSNSDVSHTSGEFTSWEPTDWKINPRFLNDIKDPDLKDWGSKLNYAWKNLGRKIVDDVKINPDRHSLLYCPHPFIIPGGRFRESYYWDNYWIVRGLLLCEMYDTVKGTILNFMKMVESIGFVPNGGRVYYTNRSQPPLLTIMVSEYVRFSGDKAFLKEALPVLVKEYLFWEQHRQVCVKDSHGKIHKMNRYAADVKEPRPESYKEDFELIHGLDEDAKLQVMTHVTSACESGWDFSSRWTGSRYDGSKGHRVLLKMRTRDIVPVDLNSILSMVERTLADFYESLGVKKYAEIFRKKYHSRVEAMEKILWNETDGVYYDYVISEKRQNRQYFISNITPLWAKPYPVSINIEERERRMYNYLQSQTYEGINLLDFPGGIPTSFNESGEQWDFPNAWPPCVHMLIEGMHNSNVSELKEEAFRQAQKWIKTCWRGFANPAYENAMFEKYNVLRDDGLPGKGGEYEVQEGFGWTNGVIMILLNMFGNHLKGNQ